MTVDEILYLVVFPGGLFFNIMYMKGILPDIPSVSLAIAIVTIGTILRSLNNLRFPQRIHLRWNELIVLFALSYIFLQIVEGFLNGPLIDSEGVDYNKFNLNRLVFYAFFYILGKNYLDFNFVKTRTLIMVYVVSTAFSLIWLDFGSLSLFGGVDQERLGLYLLISDLYVFISLSLIFRLIQNGRNLFFWIFISALVLSAMQSRASLYMFIFMTIAAIMTSVNKTRRLNLIIVLSVSVIPVLLVLNAVNPRMLAVFSIEKNSSFLSRLAQLSVGVNRIIENPIQGGYGEVLNGSAYNTVGMYIHNILSYWDNYGALVFGSLVILLFNSVRKLKHSSIKSPQGVRYLWLLYAIVQSVVAKGYSWYFLWLILGFVARKEAFTKQNNQTSKSGNVQR